MHQLGLGRTDNLALRASRELWTWNRHRYKCRQHIGDTTVKPDGAVAEHEADRLGEVTSSN